MRALLFTGKGGVGKTTIAAATALRCADTGLRTIVVSTDPAHSLADAFACPLGSDPTTVAEGLWAQQVDASERFEDAWGAIRAYLVELLGWGGLGMLVHQGALSFSLWTGVEPPLEVMRAAASARPQ